MEEAEDTIAAATGTAELTLSGLGGGSALYLSDDYNRTNNATTPGSPLVGGPYTVVTGVFGINTNALYTTTTATTNHLTFPGAVNVDMTFTLNVFSASGAGVIYRYVDASNYWTYLLTANEVVFQRNSAGTFVNVNRSGVIQTFLTTDTFRVEARNNMMYGYFNGRLVLTQKDHYYGNGATTMGVVLRNTAVRFNGLTVIGADSTLPVADGFLYRGRATKADDVAGVA